MGAAGHPAGGFDGLRHGVVIGILFVVRPRVPADHGVGLDEADQKNDAADQLVERDVAHAVVVVVQIEVAFAAENARHLVGVALVAEHVLADGAGRAEAGGVAHVVVRRADQVAGVALFDQLGDGAGGRERDVVGMRLDREQDFSLVGLSRVGALQHHAGGGLGRLLLWLRLRMRQPGDRAGGNQTATEIAP